VSSLPHFLLFYMLLINRGKIKLNQQFIWERNFWETDFFSIIYDKWKFAIFEKLLCLENHQMCNINLVHFSKTFTRCGSWMVMSVYFPTDITYDCNLTWHRWGASRPLFRFDTADACHYASDDRLDSNVLIWTAFKLDNHNL
jgi:hypothetical protein